jgi:tyrosinase
VLKRPAAPPPIRTRQNVLKLKLDDDILFFFAKAIAKLQTRPITNPLSWNYQAAIHDYRPSSNDVTKGFVAVADAATITANTNPSKMFWRACQHQSWYFLPWHRMYLSFFERIIMKIVVDEEKGPSDWALPYWNYSGTSQFGGLDFAKSSLLPEPFQSKSPRLRDGSPNPLFIPFRTPNANAGSPFLSAANVNTSTALGNSSFFAPAGTSSFGGSITKFNHFSDDPGAAAGLLELTPHGDIHSVTGPGPDRFMGSFTRAPLDPIFWLHHCNVDRLWEVWRKQPGHADPPQWTNPKTPDPISFFFHDQDGNERQMNASQVMDTKATPLGYEYDDITKPLT